MEAISKQFHLGQNQQMAKPSGRYIQGKPSGGCKELGLQQRGGTDDLGKPRPVLGVLFSTDKKLPGSIRCNNEGGSVRPDTHESRRTEDESRRSPSQQPLTKNFYNHGLLIPAIITTSFTDKERSVNTIGL